MIKLHTSLFIFLCDCITNVDISFRTQNIHSAGQIIFAFVLPIPRQSSFWDQHRHAWLRKVCSDSMHFGSQS